jgi:hypothetical protein
MNTQDLIQRILSQSRTIAVVGLSADPSKASYSVSKYMQSKGYRIIPVNPRYASEGVHILGEKCYAELHEIGFDVDIVDVFRRTEDVLPVAKEAISIGTKCLWQQLGIMNTTAHEMAQTAGLISVMDRCIKVDHAQLMT